jgi:hypothetical protein
MSRRGDLYGCTSHVRRLQRDFYHILSILARWQNLYPELGDAEQQQNQDSTLQIYSALERLAGWKD